MTHPALRFFDTHFGYSNTDEAAAALEDAYQRGRDDTLADLTNVEALNALLEDGVIGDALCLVDMDALRGELLTGWICAASRLTRAMQQAAAAADKVRRDRVAAVNLGRMK